MQTAKLETIPGSYAIDAVGQIVSVQFYGKLSVTAIAAYADALRADPGFNPRFSEIVDLRNVEELALGADQALVLADFVDPFAIGSKRAFVAVTPSQIYAARMHALLRNDDKHTRIFCDPEDARQWITEAPSSERDNVIKFPDGVQLIEKG